MTHDTRIALFLTEELVAALFTKALVKKDLG